MPRRIWTHFLPSLFEPDELAGGTAVMIDVLRASTTICHALDAGATMVVPCETVDEAKLESAQLADRQPLTGGERSGLQIDGFDLDNSPLRYRPEVVKGRPIVFTTTNGTRALLRCQSAERILIGAFVNLSSIVRELLASTTDAHLVCAGTDGRITAEDVLFAGAVASRLTEHEPDDASRIAIAAYETSLRDGSIHDALRASRGGRNLISLGLDNDIERAAEMDRFDIVPTWSAAARRICVAPNSLA